MHFHADVSVADDTVPTHISGSISYLMTFSSRFYEKPILPVFYERS